MIHAFLRADPLALPAALLIAALAAWRSSGLAIRWGLPRLLA